MPAEAAASVLSIPTIVWSGVVASFISLGGVVLSNRSSLERLKEQLRHDSGERHKDRLYELRKDLYLELTAQMTGALGHLGSLAAKDPTADDLAGPFQSVIAGLAKAQLVGTRQTAALASELSTSYGEALIHLIGAAKPMHDLKSDIKISGDMYDQEFAQARRVLSEITTLNESGAPNPAKMSALQRSFENYKNNYTHYSNERDTAWAKYNNLHRSFLAAVSEELNKIAPIQIHLVSAIRAEVGLDTDTSELVQRMENNQARMIHATEDLLAKLERS